MSIEPAKRLNNTGSATHEGHIALRPGPLGSVVTMMTIGTLGAVMSPYMIEVTRSVLDVEMRTAGILVSAQLLTSALITFAVARLANGPHRIRLAGVGLLMVIIGFAGAAFISAPPVFLTALFIGAAGLGIIGAAGGAAFAAFRDLNRASGVFGVTNRIICAGILSMIPIFSGGPAIVFGSFSALALCGLAVLFLLPRAPLATARGLEGQQQSALQDKPSHGDIRMPGRLKLAGAGIVILSAFLGIMTDAFYAVILRVAQDQVNMTMAQTGMLLSGLTLGGFLGSFILLLGRRLGRPISLTMFMVSAACMILLATVTNSIPVFAASVLIFGVLGNPILCLFMATAGAVDETGRWSGQVMASYMVGASFAPFIGSSVYDAAGPLGVGLVAVGVCAVITPLAAYCALVSIRAERAFEMREASSAGYFAQGSLSPS